MLVRVLVRAVYNGPDHKSLGWQDVDNIIEVAGGEYARGLITKGFVTDQLDVPVIPLENEPDATIAARRVAARNQVDLRQVEGHGAGGRVLKKDVLQYLKDNVWTVSDET